MTELVVDTNILLLHAFSRFNSGRYLRSVWPSTVDWAESPQISRWLNTILPSFTLVTTPQALLEFKHVAESRSGLNSQGLQQFMSSYAPYLLALHEEYSPAEQIMTYEQAENAWWLCFADTSLLLAAFRRKATYFTLDWPAYEFCVKKGGLARHLVEWYYSV